MSESWARTESWDADGISISRPMGAMRRAESLNISASDAPSAAHSMTRVAHSIGSHLSRAFTAPDLRALRVILRPPTTPTEHVRAFFSPTLLVTIALSLAATLALAFAETPPHFHARGRDGRDRDVPAWEAYLVANIVLWGIVLMVRGYRADFVLFGEVAVFGVCGIINSREGLEGFMNDGNIIGSCLLFVITRSIQKAGILEQFALNVLGEPKTQTAALLRVVLPSLPAACFMNSPAVTSVMTPLVTNWAKRLQLDERALILPMAIATSMGSCMCVLGCGSAMVSRMTFARDFDLDLQTFTITPVAVILAAAYMAWLMTVGRFLLPGKKSDDELSAPVMPPADSDDDGVFPSQRRGSKAGASLGRSYRMEIRVDADCMLLSKRIGGVGLDKLEGVRFLKADGAGGVAEGPNAVADWKLCTGDLLWADLTARGAATIQQVKGLRFQSSEPHRTQLGGRRHRRILMEAVLSPSSTLVGRSLIDMWGDVDFLFRLPAAVLAARRPGGSMSDSTSLVPGDVLLAEVDHDFPEKPLASNHFSVMAQIPDSQPLRDKPLDLARGYCMFALMLGSTILSMVVEGLELVYIIILVCGVCIISRAVTPDDAWQSVRGSVYVSIAAAFGIGKAMENCGLTAAIAQGVLSIIGTDGAFKSMMAIGFVTTFLTQFLSNTATIVLIAPVAKGIIEATGFGSFRRATAFLLVYTANASYSTPIATPPNLICSTSGANYTWREFFVFGFPLQVLFLPLTVAVCIWMYGPVAEAVVA